MIVFGVDLAWVVRTVGIVIILSTLPTLITIQLLAVNLNLQMDVVKSVMFVLAELQRLRLHPHLPR